MAGIPSSLNPLRCAGTALPPNVLLLAKLLVLCLLLKGYLHEIRPVFLPFLSPLEAVDPVLFQRTLQGAFLVASAALLLNLRVRAACLVLGAVFLLAVLASKPGYRNATVYVGCVLLLAGLQTAGAAPWLLRAQVALLYLGAGLNKLFEADWRNGQYVEHWLVQVLTNPYYEAMTHGLPPLALSLLLGWAAILSELGIGAGALVRALRPAAIWWGAAFHTGVLLMTHQDFGIFLTAILASYLALVDWPVVAEVQVAPGSRYRGFVRALAAALDLDGTLRVGAASEPERALSLRAGRSRLHGVEALARLLLLLPATYFLLAVLLTGPKWVRWGGALGALVAFTPWRTLLRRVWELSPARRWLPSAPAAG